MVVRVAGHFTIDFGQPAAPPDLDPTMTNPCPTESAFADLHAAVRRISTARLFTVTVYDPNAAVSRRAYTSHPQEYPVSGTKPMVSDDWSRAVLDRHETFIANTTAEFAPYFPDHALITALGCQAAINIPILQDGKVLGTVNILDVENHFSPQRVQALSAVVAAHQDALLDAILRTKPDA